MAEIVPLMTAHKVYKENQAASARITDTLDKAHGLGARAQEALDISYSNTFDGYLGPFVELFSQLKNAELDELPTVTAVPELNGLDIELKTAGLKAIGALTSVAGGGVVGAAASGVTLAGVAAFATASTGTAIGSLSGAAATSATLAWLGGGSLAAGGGGVAAGTIVLGGLVTVPVVVALLGYVHLKGKKSLREQLAIQAELTEAEWEAEIHAAKVKRSSSHVERTVTVIDALTDIGGSRLEAFATILKRTTDYSILDATERQTIAENAGLAVTIAAVIACPLLRANGSVSTESTDTIRSASLLAERLAP